MTRAARLLAGGACVGVLLCIGIGVAAYRRSHHAWGVARVPRGSVTGGAAAAVGDSGVFASPVLPRGARPAIPPTDAESAGVAMGYWDAPSVQDRTARYNHQIPTERRRFCGRSYYVLPVVAMPDTTVVRSHTANDWMMWAPTWVIPICDDRGIVRTSVQFTDLRPGLRVIQGAGPRDVPELVPDSGTFPHIGQSKATQLPDWEGGIGMTPETAVAVTVATLGATGARVAEVPEALEMVRLLDPQPPAIRAPRIFGDIATCPRWRLTLDRAVTLRGMKSGQVVHTRGVYVSRNTGGCSGDPEIEIPLPAQPTTVPFLYDASPPPQPRRRVVRPRATNDRWMALRVLEPLWFEEARLVAVLR